MRWLYAMPRTTTKMRTTSKAMMPTRWSGVKLFQMRRALRWTVSTLRIHMGRESAGWETERRRQEGDDEEEG